MIELPKPWQPIARTTASAVYEVASLTPVSVKL